MAVVLLALEMLLEYKVNCNPMWLWHSLELEGKHLGVTSLMRGRCIKMLQLEEGVVSAINRRTSNRATILEELKHRLMQTDNSLDTRDQTRATQEAQTSASAKVPDPKTLKPVATMYTTCLASNRTK